MNLLITQFSPVSYHILPLRSKQSPQHYFFSIGFYSHYYYADLLPSLMDLSIHIDIW
jgi:hypothetical protein